MSGLDLKNTFTLQSASEVSRLCSAVLNSIGITYFNFDIYETMWGPSEFNCTGNLSSYERGSKLSELSVPVLLLCGDQDEVREETLLKYMKNLPSGSYMHVFQNSAHNTYLEATEDYINVVKQFIKNVERALDEN